MLIKRNETYMGHRANAVKRLFVCGECGSKLVEKYHADGSLIQCAKDSSHAGVTKESDWLDDHVKPRKVYDELEELAELNPDVRHLKDKVKKENRKALYGE